MGRVALGALILRSLVLVILGITGVRALVSNGTMPPELVGRRVGSTVGWLFFGLGILVWSFVAGHPWARRQVEGRKRNAMARGGT